MFFHMFIFMCFIRISISDDRTIVFNLEYRFAYLVIFMELLPCRCNGNGFGYIVMFSKGLIKMPKHPIEHRDGKSCKETRDTLNNRFAAMNEKQRSNEISKSIVAYRKAFDRSVELMKRDKSAEELLEEKKLDSIQEETYADCGDYASLVCGSMDTEEINTMLRVWGEVYGGGSNSPLAENYLYAI